MLRPIHTWLPLGSVSVNSRIPHGWSDNVVTGNPAVYSSLCHASTSRTIR
jgi:hypothetical protein